MDLTIFLALLGFPAFAFWSSGRDAAERAIEYGRQSCQRAGVQWLDQSAHLVRLRLRRNARGRLSWERQFRYEYSTAGEDRQAGLVTLIGRELVSLVGPMPAESSVLGP